MDSQKHEPQEPTDPQPAVKKKRFQLIKLEERIAPKGKGISNGNSPNAGGFGNTNKCPIW